MLQSPCMTLNRISGWMYKIVPTAFLVGSCFCSSAKIITKVIQSLLFNCFEQRNMCPIHSHKRGGFRAKQVFNGDILALPFREREYELAEIF